MQKLFAYVFYGVLLNIASKTVKNDKTCILYD